MILVCTVYDEGAMGARIVVTGKKPSIRTIYGGWITTDGGANWWTHIKGKLASYICDDIDGTANNLVAIRFDSDGVPVARAQHRIFDCADEMQSEMLDFCKRGQLRFRPFG